MKVDKEDMREAFKILEGEMQRDVDSRLIDYATEYKEAEEDGR